MVSQAVEIVPGAIKASDRYLLVILGTGVELGTINQLPEAGFCIGQDHFRDLGLGDATGWYDWLVTSDDIPIGVRYIPRGESETLAQELRRLPSASASKHDDVAIEVFFGPSREYDVMRSSDQAMGGNRLYANDTGRYAISFDMKWLVPEVRAFIAKRY